MVKPIVNVMSERSMVNGGIIPMGYPLRNMFVMGPPGAIAFNTSPRIPPNRPPRMRNIKKSQVVFVDTGIG